MWNGHNVNMIYALCRGIQDDDGCKEIAGQLASDFSFWGRNCSGASHLKRI